MSKQVQFEAPDVSVYQGNINMKAVRDAGYGSIGIRAGYGRNNIDQKFAGNAAACVNLGMRVMIYWFSYAYTTDMAAAEADFAIAQANDYWKRCPIAYDLEYDTRRFAASKGVNIDKRLATDMAVAFLRKVKDSGYIPVLYTNRDYLKNYFDMSRIAAELGTVYVWFALYANTLPAAELDIADLWQYTSSGRVPGISGNVDLNKVYTNIWADAVSIGAPTETVTEMKNYQVVKGDTLTGIGKKLGVDWKLIAEANNIQSPYTIYVGQPLKIPYVMNVPSTEKEPEPNLYIKEFQAAANADKYLDAQGKKLAENGIDDVATQFVRKQILLQARREDAHWIERSTGKVVGWLQERLNEVLDLSLEITEEYDAATVAAVKTLQKKFGLAVDGIAGYNTIQLLFYH